VAKCIYAEVLTGTIAAILDWKDKNAQHPSAQGWQKALIPLILGTEIAASIEIKPH